MYILEYPETLFEEARLASKETLYNVQSCREMYVGKYIWLQAVQRAEILYSTETACSVRLTVWISSNASKAEDTLWNTDSTYDT